MSDWRFDRRVYGHELGSTTQSVLHRLWLQMMSLAQFGLFLALFLYSGRKGRRVIHLYLCQCCWCSLHMHQVDQRWCFFFIKALWCLKLNFVKHWYALFYIVNTHTHIFCYRYSLMYVLLYSTQHEYLHEFQPCVSSCVLSCFNKKKLCMFRGLWQIMCTLT